MLRDCLFSRYGQIELEKGTVLGARIILGDCEFMGFTPSSSGRSQSTLQRDSIKYHFRPECVKIYADLNIYQRTGPESKDY